MADSTASSPDIVVIGAGAVGASVAAELARDGAEVTLLERGPELGWGCSAGNAGLLGASHVLPLATPQALLDGLRWLPRSDSPFGMRPRPRLLPWLTRFTAAAAPRRVRRSTRILRDLAVRSAALHAELAADGLDARFERRGLLNVYQTRRAFSDAARTAAADAADGMPAEIIEGPAVRERFDAVAGTPAGAVLYPDEAQCEPLRFVQAMGRRAADAGCEIRTGVEVLALRRTGSRVESLSTTKGELRAGQVVVATGVWSPRLAAGLALRLPVEAGKGYHVDVAPYPGLPDHPIWFQEDRIVATPLEGRLRLAGTLELSGIDQRIDPRRVRSLLRAGGSGLRGFERPVVRDIWCGLRPCSPDGLPIIGRAPGLDNLVLATGHGMWGLQLGPLTGRLVAAVASGAPGDDDLHPLRPGRFA